LELVQTAANPIMPNKIKILFAQKEITTYLLISNTKIYVNKKMTLHRKYVVA